MLATAPRVTKFPIEWDDGAGNDNMDTEGGIEENGTSDIKQDTTESNQINPPSAAQHDFNSKQSLGIGHDSNSLNLSEPMAS